MEENKDLETDDGRKIVAFSTAGESFTVESTEQTAKGQSAEVEVEVAKMKLHAMKRGIRHIRL